MDGARGEQLQLTVKALQNKFRKTYDDDDSSFYCQDLEDQRLKELSLWNPLSRHACSSSSSSDSSSEVTKKAEPEVNNSAHGLDMLNLPSQAELLLKQKSWMNVYFRYRVKWCQAKPHLQTMSKEDAYLPENLKLWTRYVKVALQRKTPLIHAVRVFRNRIRLPDSLIRFTLNSFYTKDCETEKAKNAGPLHPVALPIFRCPDEFPEIQKMPVATLNIFVTTEAAYFDDFWKACAAGGH